MVIIQQAVREMLKGRELDFIRAIISDSTDVPSDSVSSYLVDMMLEHHPQRLIELAGAYLYDHVEVQS